MKRFLSLIMYLSCFVIIQKIPVSAMQEPDFCYKRACWISYLDFEQYLRDLDENEFIQMVNCMYDKILAQDLNTVVVQVRAFGDAIYPSNIYPTAAYLSTNRKIPDYDALAIMLQIAHEKGLFFEAWINPYRLSKDNKTTESYKQTAFYDTYQDIIIEYASMSGELALSLDPSVERTRELIVAGIDEILAKYDVDGIHFDDYFYMEHMADSLTIDEKMSNVNQLIQAVHQCTASYQVTFGISPAGNIDYAKSIGADIETWLSEEGYIDYIMPQLYWSDHYMVDNQEIPLYSNRCEEWKLLNQIKLPIYTGLGLYRAQSEDSADLGWRAKNTNLKEQWETAYRHGYNGYCLFRYAWLEKECAMPELVNLKQYANAIDENQKKTDERMNDIQIHYRPAGTEENSFFGEILVCFYKTDGTVIHKRMSCRSFVIDIKDIRDVTITYLNGKNEACMAFYCSKTADDKWNPWVFDGSYSNYVQSSTIEEVKVMRIPKHNRIPFLLPFL